jgi:ABC-type nickel/cobalt efflux system permease component RcnA
MRHALEPDHVAAVATLAARSRGPRETVLQGAVWGLGHTITLLVVGGVCLLLRATIPQRLAASLEGAVGVMLLLLGADVLVRMRRRGVHLHVHRHDDGTVHLHAHRHAPGAAHDVHDAGDAHDAHHAQDTHNAVRHEHAHVHGFPRRALLVGLVHGLAGSAALLLLTLTTLGSAWLGVAYIAVFGIGSIAGMAVLAGVMSLPLQGPARRLTRWRAGLEAVIGCGTLAVGGWVIYNTPWVQGLFR